MIAEALDPGFDYAGVDLQARLVDDARRTRPFVTFEIADVTTFWVGRRFDVVTCLGNVLSYLRTDEELLAACATLAAHA